MSAANSILFRVDSGLKIGTGHIMRCLTLADALKSHGTDDSVKVTFVTRENRGNVIAAISDKGYDTTVLACNAGLPYGDHPSPPSHASWLDASWREDAAATRAVLEQTGARWLVMDHYALDIAWQEAALPYGVSLLVLDDLADRPHRADVLVDQNFGRNLVDYQRLVPSGCELRIGPSQALLRPEFGLMRPDALDRRRTLTYPKELLITLGGVDKDNVSNRILEALAASSSLALDMHITVVLGVNAPHFSAVQAMAGSLPMQVDVVSGVSNMAERMLSADLCIGAVGSTTWERCALGLPTLQVVLADNQCDAANAMAAQGLSIALPKPHTQDFGAALEAGIKKLLCVDTYRNMARKSAALTDGTGANRLATRLLTQQLQGEAARAN